MTSIIKLKMRSYKKIFVCVRTYSIFWLFNQNWWLGHANMERWWVWSAWHLHYSATQIPAQSLTPESENANYMTAQFKETLEMTLPNPFIL